ncbi:hypothetical protein CHR56_37730 (plasmid) [Rhizobium leguminosarum bv. viciae]|nr:hypothetical protein CHR56_37730 [Rhizobium leguminosarum bv. viciae]
MHLSELRLAEPPCWNLRYRIALAIDDEALAGISAALRYCVIITPHFRLLVTTVLLIVVPID